MRWIVRGLSAVVMLVALALAGLWLIPSDLVARLAATEFQRLTGRSLTVQDGVRARIWPSPGITTGPVTIANADWSAEGPMLRAEALAVTLDLGAALGGTLRLRDLRLQGPRLVLERAADGRVNWTSAVPDGVSVPAGGAGAGRGTAPPALDLMAISDGSVLWIDHAAGTRRSIDLIEAEALFPGEAGQLRLTVAARSGDTPLRLSGEVGDLAQALAGGVVPVSLTGAVGGSTAEFSGRAGGSPLVAEGRLAADLADLRGIAAVTGGAVPDLPEGLGRRMREMSGQVTVAPAGSVHLREGAMVLDTNRLALAADITFDGPRPRIAAQVQAAILNLPGLAPSPVPATAPAAAAPRDADAGWSRAPLDASALGLMDAEVALRAGGIDLGGTRIGPLRLQMTVDRARAVFEAREMQAWGGQITGQFVVNARSGLSVGGDLVFAGLAMQPLLTELAGYDRLSAPGDLRVKFLGVGNSLAAIMAGLSGEGRMVLGQGELRGLDLLGMLRNLDPGYVGEGRRTIFDAVSGSFTIADGVLRNDDLRMAAPYLNVAGQGTAGLGAQVIDYRITPTALSNADGTGGVRVPLTITGPWSDPSFRLDLKALADQELAEERARLEARAKEAEARMRAAVEAKAASELGVVRQEGESLEDAVRRRAEEALRNEAGRLLNGVLGGN